MGKNSLAADIILNSDIPISYQVCLLLFAGFISLKYY